MAKFIVEKDRIAIPTTVEVYGEGGITPVKWEPVFKVYSQGKWEEIQEEWERDKRKRVDVLKEHLLGWNLLQGDDGNIEPTAENIAEALAIPVYQNAAWNAFVAAHVPAIRKRVSLGN